MEYLLDIHTHTVAGGHAYSTIKENVDYAQKIGLSLLGISEHAPAMPHSTHEFFFSNLGILPRKFGDLDVMFGVELNIMDYDGNVDLKKWALERTDYAIASLHPPCVRPGSAEENTAALLGAIKNPFVNIIGHPCDPRYPFDIPAVVKAAAENNVLLEINNASYGANNGRRGGEDITVQMLLECKKRGLPVILGSDAHFYSAVGNFSNTLPLLERAEMPKELVINRSVDKLLEFIGKK
ncbi:MAG: phosphatase [Firmicutes bacterium]|nr:phosphatase [Bacillota bacterium]